MVANGINAAALFDHLVNVDKFDFATAQTIVNDELAKQAAKVAAQPVGETLTLSQKVNKQLGIGKKAPKINAKKSPFAQAGIVKKGGELTKKGKKLIQAHPNAKATIDGAKAYKAREAARLAKEKVRLAKNAEHVAKLRQTTGTTTTTTAQSIFGKIKDSAVKMFNKFKNSSVGKTLSNGVSKLANVVKKHPIAAIAVTALVAFVGAKVLSGGSETSEA